MAYALPRLGPLLTLTACLLLLVAVQPARAKLQPEDPVAALERHAQPLRSTGPTGPTGSLNDLKPFGRMVGDATVVGVGEATQGSREFFTMGIASSGTSWGRRDSLPSRSRSPGAAG